MSEGIKNWKIKQRGMSIAAKTTTDDATGIETQVITVTKGRKTSHMTFKTDLATGKLLLPDELTGAAEPSMRAELAALASIQVKRIEADPEARI